MTAATVRSSGSGAEQDGITDVARGYGDGSGLKPGWGVSPERQQAIAHQDLSGIVDDPSCQLGATDVDGEVAASHAARP